MTVRVLASLMVIGLTADAVSRAPVGHIPEAPQLAPLQLTVLIDVSYTMHPRPVQRSTDTFVNGLSVENIGRGLTRLFDLLEPSDTVRLATFTGPPAFLTPFTSDRPTLDQAVRRFQALTQEERFGPSAIWDALVIAAEAAPTGSPDMSHSILLVSDGRGTGNRLSLDSAIGRLVALKTRVSAVSIPSVVEFTDGRRSYRVDGADVLKRITDATGGLHLQYIPAEKHAFPLFERVVRFLRARTPAQ